MTQNIEDYMTTRDAANAIGIHYDTLKRRLRKGKIVHERIGWTILIHKDEVKRLKKQEQQNAIDKNLEKNPR